MKIDGTNFESDEWGVAEL